MLELGTAAKAHWGYDRAWVEEWGRREFSPERVRAKEILVAEEGGRAVAWAGLERRGEVWWLDDLWVEPERIGTGIGTELFRRAAERGRRLGYHRMEWEAEPNAVGFYERLGARHLRESETTELGRRLSVMGIDL